MYITDYKKAGNKIGGTTHAGNIIADSPFAVYISDGSDLGKWKHVKKVGNNPRIKNAWEASKEYLKKFFKGL